MQVAVFDDVTEMGAVGARRIASLFTRRPRSVLGLATGSSPLPLYDAIVSEYQAGKVSFAQAQAFCLDEYVGLPADHPEGYLNFIRRVFTDRVDFAADAVHAPAGTSSNPIAAAAEYDAQIHAAGGVDLQVLGIGSDGHIGFNEPGGSLRSRTHWGHLTLQTRKDNARFFGGDVSSVPESCLTQGLGTIMDARELLMVVNGENKAEAVAQMVEGPVSAHWPATVIQAHENAVILLDEAAASKLKLRDFYQESWETFLQYQWSHGE